MRVCGPALFVLLCAASCNDGGQSAPTNGPVHASARTTTVGWLGARVSPMVSTLDIDVEGDMHAPGGLVVAHLDAGSPLDAAGVREGDVLVRVGEDWVPLRQDPTFDFVELVEQNVSGGESELTLAVWRAGKYVELALNCELSALEVGLPVEVERFRDGATAAANRLLEWQREDGGWPASDGASELAVDALAGLALLSLEDDELAQAGAARAAQRVEALAKELDEPRPIGLALSVCFLAERIGPLPAELLLAVGPAKSRPSAAAGAPAGLPTEGVTMVFSGSELPEGFEFSPADAEGEVQMVTISGAGGVLPGAEPPEGAMSFEAQPAPAAEGPDLEALLEEHDPGRAAELAALSVLVDALIAAQAEDGSWGPPGDEEAARLFPTAFALSALGAAQRVGLELASEPVETGAARLRELSHDGQIAAAVARGADRRDEAGRAAAVAFAFVALGCAETDPFVQAASQYGEEAGRHLLVCASDLSHQLFFTALWRRHAGLAKWARFYDEFRVPLVAWQRPDGAFEIPQSRDDIAQGESAPTFDTALGALLLALQSESLPVLLALAENPLAPTIDGEGKRSDPSDDASSADEETEGLPADVDAEELRKMLESMGIDPDSADIQISVGGAESEDD